MPTVIVSAVLVVALGVAGFMYKSIVDETHETRLAVSRLTVDVAVLQMDVKRLEASTDSRGAKIEIMSDKLVDLTRAMDDLKARQRR